MLFFSLWVSINVEKIDQLLVTFRPNKLVIIIARRKFIGSLLSKAFSFYCEMWRWSVSSWWRLVSFFFCVWMKKKTTTTTTTIFLKTSLFAADTNFGENSYYSGLSISWTPVNFWCWEPLPLVTWICFNKFFLVSSGIWNFRLGEASFWFQGSNNPS